MNTPFLPVTQKDLKDRGWQELDFIIVTGDAYVDHPSFGTAIISRVLEAAGFKIGIISQPDWQDVEAFRTLGRPKYAFLVTAGNLDSMVSHYTSRKKVRNQDAYSPGGEAGRRPDRATIVYTSKVKQAYKGIPVIIGGIEASLRRLGHYDYWSNKVRRSILLDSKADLLVYGMAEWTIRQIAAKLKAGSDIKDILDIPGTVVKTKSLDGVSDPVMLPAFEEIQKEKELYAQSCKLQYSQADPVTGKVVVEKTGDFYIVQNKPSPVLTTEEMDTIYNLPYTRTYHPMYEKAGGIPALKEVKFGLVSSRGCFGGCNFCAITTHQGRIIQARSHESLVEEAKILMDDPEFKGYIHDVGGPTANFRIPACGKQVKQGSCGEKKCLAPGVCKNLKADHRDYITLLRRLKGLKKVKKVFIRSGIRFDYLMADSDDSFFLELCKDHISGQLKIAPEHVSNKVLDLMGKPKHSVYEGFIKRYYEINKKIGKKQYHVPYFISSHPGSDLKAAIELAVYLKKSGFIPDQVQDFYPTPGTISTCMFYTGINPLSMQKVYVPRDMHEKDMQRALIQFHKPENYNLVYKALEKAGRKDLIGYAKSSLIQPKNTKQRSRRNSR